MQLFTNNADSILNGAIADVTTSITVKTGEGVKFPSPTGGDFFLVTLFQKVGATETNHEIVKCTSRTGDVLTVVRAQEGTTAKSFSNGDSAELRETAGTLAAKADLASPTFTGTVAGITAAMVGAPSGSGTSTGTNTGDYIHPANHVASVITQDASNRFVTDAEKATWNAKGVGDVTLTGAQTLTNKTITDTVYAVTGTAPALTATNGAVQTWTLTAASSPTNALISGQSIILQITPGAFTITWPSVVFTKQGGSGAAPTLFSAGKTTMVLWMVGAVLYGSHLGDTV